MSWDPFQREVLAELGHVLYRQAGVAPMSAIDAAPVDAAPVHAASSDDPMLARLARAAGLSVDALQVQFDDARVFAGLRGDAAAKRALWPRLRALRAARA